MRILFEYYVRFQAPRLATEDEAGLGEEHLKQMSTNLVVDLRTFEVVSTKVQDEQVS